VSTFVALLRAINVAGTRKVAMADLKAFFEALGFADVRTLLQTGNVVFADAARSAATVERTLEAEAKLRLGLDTDVFVRTGKDLAAIVRRNPFQAEAKRDPGHLVVQFAKRAPARAEVKALEAAILGPERVRARGQELYVVYPAGIGRSKLTATLMEKKLGTRVTGRNWNTVTKLASLAEA
jgi:uncharacterized protein (DUF1697 family)